MADAPSFLAHFTDSKHSDETLGTIAQIMVGVFALAWAWREVSGYARHQRRFANLLKRAGDSRTHLKKITRVAVSCVLVLIALAAAVTYFYGSKGDGTYVHRWDAYHTTIGAKYFDELGYFETYRCSIVADKEGRRDFRRVKKVRDLRTRKHVKLKKHLKNNDCRARFSDERWDTFKKDLETFSRWTGRRTWPRLFNDKGFNGTPSYTVLVRSLIDLSQVSKGWISNLALLDPLLMMGAFGAVAWAFGINRAALVATCFCTIFPNRFIHMGGSILRFDYVALSIVALCALRKNRWGLAGFCLGWATMVRVFPLFFAAGIFLKILVEVVTSRRLSRKRRDFVFWYAGTCAILLACSLIFLDRGLGSWLDWFENMRVHNMKSAGFRVGFRHLFMFDGELGKTHFGHMQELYEDRRAYYLAAVAALYTPYLMALRRLNYVSFSALFGLLSFFMLTVATRYYYGVMAILLLVDRNPLKNRYMILLTGMLFLASAVDFSYYDLNSYDAFMYNQMVSVQFAIVFAVLGSWLLFKPSLVDPVRHADASSSAPWADPPSAEPPPAEPPPAEPPSTNTAADAVRP